MRILRIFKLVRHFVGLQSLVYTLHQAYKDLGLILIIVAVTVLMFSSLVFAFEQESKIFRYWMSPKEREWCDNSACLFEIVNIKVMITSTGHSTIASGGGWWLWPRWVITSSLRHSCPSSRVGSARCAGCLSSLCQYPSVRIISRSPIIYFKSFLEVVSSFAICYRNKLWRNEINVRKRMARKMKRNTKEDIIFNLSTSSGMSGLQI